MLKKDIVTMDVAVLDDEYEGMEQTIELLA
jgi:hypothetical protein